MSNPTTNAFASQLKAQQELFSQLTATVFQGAQQISQLNLQLGQQLLEDLSNTRHEMLQAQNPADLAAAATLHVQPMAERLRNYRQGLVSVAAGTNAALAKTAETQLPEISRKTAEVADEVAKDVTEKIDQAAQLSRETAQKTEESARNAIEAMRQKSKPEKQAQPPRPPAGAGTPPPAQQRP